MRAPAIPRRRLLWTLVAVAALPGCSSTPPRLYVLSPLPQSATNGAATSGTTGGTTSPIGGRTVGVQLVTLPEYLDRPEIVSYTGPYELSANRDDRWAERLPSNITRVLAENLSVLLGTDRVHTAPSRVSDRFDYEVSVEFDRFERTAAGDSALDAHWAVRDGVTQKVLARDQTHLATRVPDNGYPTLVAAMNDNLTALSRDIAAAIAKLPRKGGTRAGA
ncbi:PqiC family protein [Azospirillum sp. sgz302134]